VEMEMELLAEVWITRGGLGLCQALHGVLKQGCHPLWGPQT
jgi:hypothetical protein